MGIGIFGVWDAPATDDLPAIPAPVGHRCVHCREAIAADDNGAVMPMGVVHRECQLRVVVGGIGHEVNHARYCHGELGTDAGLTYRASALLRVGLLRQRPCRDRGRPSSGPPPPRAALDKWRYGNVTDWEQRRPNEQTATYLGRVLDDYLGLADMARRAREGHFDDYFAPPEIADGAEITRLVRELTGKAQIVPKSDRARILAVRDAAMNGEFDGTKAESDRWMASKDAQDAFREFGGNAS